MLIQVKIVFRTSYLKRTDTLPGEATVSKLFCLPSEKGICSKRKDLLLQEAIFFLLEQTLFQKGFSVHENGQEVTNFVSLVKNGRKFTKCIKSP